MPQVREPGGDEADGSDEVDVVNAYADVSGGNTTVAPGDDTVIEHEPRGDLLLPTAPSCASISLDGSEGDERDGQSSPGDPSRPASAALDEDQKQQRILSAMERAPQGAGLTDLMNRVVNPRHQSWLQGLWSRKSSGASEASKPTSERSASQDHGDDGVIFRGMDASPSIYSTESMDRASDMSPRPERAPSVTTHRTRSMLSRKSTATSKHSHHTSSTQASSRPSDDEREAFERRRASNLAAREILERESKQGMSGDFRTQVLGSPDQPTTPTIHTCLLYTSDAADD